MAITYDSGSGASNVAPPTLATSPDKYVSLGDLLDPTKPDNRDLLVSTYGDQGITGFLTLTGAVNNAGTADEVQWWEEGRLHKTFSGWLDVNGGTGGINALIGGDAGAASGYLQLRLNDVILDSSGNRHIVTKVTAATGSVADKYDVVPMDGSVATADIGNASDVRSFAIIGNIYAQGTDQPSTFYNPGIQKYINPYIITKETFAVNGSQATNIGWVNIGNGEYRWYVKGEMDTRKRFMNQREMMLLYGQAVADTATPGADTIALASGSVPGSEGYFQAVERRGLVASVSGGAQGTFADMSDIDGIILELDIDDMLAQGIATQVTAGLPGQFGAFNNDADMAVRLGFKSFTRGGYTFHKHDWKLLNDPTLGAIGDVKGAMVPLANVVDAKTGNSAPALEMNYKGASGYNRDVEHWVRGSILGYNNMSEDVAEFYYRSECNLVTRAANKHVLIK
jgi:hypothetical protein